MLILVSNGPSFYNLTSELLVIVNEATMIYNGSEWSKKQFCGLANTPWQSNIAGWKRAIPIDKLSRNGGLSSQLCQVNRVVTQDFRNEVGYICLTDSFNRDDALRCTLSPFIDAAVSMVTITCLLEDNPSTPSLESFLISFPYKTRDV